MPLSQRRQEARLILFYKIINGLAQVPFEGVLVEAYKGTRRKHNMKFRQICHTIGQYGQSVFPKTISAWNRLAFAEAPSLAVFRSNFLKFNDQMPFLASNNHMHTSMLYIINKNNYYFRSLKTDPQRY